MSQGWLGRRLFKSRRQDPVVSPIVTVGQHMASLSDDRLRELGIANPTAMRCMGFTRYCAAEARHRERS